MNENELIQQLMSEYFYEITDENYLDKYNFDCIKKYFKCNDMTIKNAIAIFFP